MDDLCNVLIVNFEQNSNECYNFILSIILVSFLLCLQFAQKIA